MTIFYFISIENMINGTSPLFDATICFFFYFRLKTDLFISKKCTHTLCTYVVWSRLKNNSKHIKFYINKN